MAKHDRKRCALLLVAIPLAFAAALPGQSLADSTVVGPTVCRRAGTSNALGLQYTADSVTNVSGTSIQIECSIVRDNTSNTNGLLDLEIAVTDTTTGSIFCDALAVDRNGIIQKVTRKVSTKLGPQVLDFGSALNVSTSKGTYVMNCSVPNGARIHSIYINEP